MQMDEHTSEMVWTWTINELCRKVAPIPMEISELSPKRLTDRFLGIRTHL